MRWIVGILLPCLLSGCTFLGLQKEKVPLAGKRISVFESSETLVSNAAGARPVSWPAGGYQGAWLQPYGTADHNIGVLDLPACLEVKWQESLGGYYPMLSQPVLHHDRLFFLNGSGMVYAVNMKGETLWTFDTKEEGLGGGVCCDGQGTIYVATSGRCLLALEEKSGKVRWKGALSAPMRNAPLFYKGYLLCLNVMNQLEVFQSHNGTLVWDHVGMASETHLLGGSVPAVAENIVVVGHSSGEVVALSLKNGDVLWSQGGAPIHAMEGSYQLAHIKAPPVIHGHQVYTISYNAQLSCFDLLTGQVLWQKPIGGIYPPVIVGNALYCVSHENNLMALDCASGNLLWMTSLPQQDRGMSWAGPIAAGNYLYVGGIDGRLLALDPRKKGCVAREYAVGRGISLSPCVGHGRMCLVTQGGGIVLLEGTRPSAAKSSAAR